MADVANDTPCATCGHPASGHADTADGANTGSCSMKTGDETCSCEAMAMDADGTSGASLERIATMADDSAASAASGTAASGAAPVSDEAKAAVSKIDGIIDSALEAIKSTGITGLDPNVIAFIGLAHAADNCSDMLLGRLGIADADGDPVKPDDDAGDALILAESLDAALSAAVATWEKVTDGSAPAEVAQAADLIKQADAASADLLVALGAPDPQKAPPADAPAAPDAAPPAAGDGQASARSVGFADGDPADAPSGDDSGSGDGSGGGSDDGDATTQAVSVEGEIPFTMPVMVLENVETGDGRKIAAGVLVWRDLPLPVMVLTKTTYEHQEAVVGGRLDSIERIDASGMTNPKTGQPYGEGVTALAAKGAFAPQALTGFDIEGLVGGGFLRGVSVDLCDVEVEYVSDDSDDGGLDEDDLLDMLMGGMGGTEVYTAGRVMGVTVCPFPAFEGAYVELASGAATPVTPVAPEDGVKRQAITVHDVFGERECDVCEDGGPMVASAGPMNPPGEWFEDPRLSGPTPLTVTEDGRIYGHLAAWNTCHTGVAGRCTTAPRSRTGYSYFHTGGLLTAEGETLSVGHITMGTGHANLSLAASPAMEHYDDTGACVADVRAGEDAYGIWIAGATRPNLTELQARGLRAAALSGDWRRIGAGLELVAALSVNVPGFPVVRSRVASGAPASLVAAGGRAVIRAAFASNEALREVLAWKRETEPVLLDYRASKARERFEAHRKE